MHLEELHRHITLAGRIPTYANNSIKQRLAVNPRLLQLGYEELNLLLVSEKPEMSFELTLGRTGVSLSSVPAPSIIRRYEPAPFFVLHVGCDRLACQLLNTISVNWLTTKDDLTIWLCVCL